MKATTDWIAFFAYVSFFPSILSGPIDRARTFIPQLEKKREFNYHKATDALRQILWGLFKKVVIADNCAPYVDNIFKNYHWLPASSLLLGAFLYAIQMYADFSGYSEMAIGISKLLGLEVTKNFNFPFFSQNIAEFWRNWHMSLTSWLTEYVFTPLSIYFRDYGKLGLVIAIVLNFTICGIWHGANWTYVLFGFLHGCYFIPLILNGTMNKKKKITKGKMLPSIHEFLNMFGTFTLVMLTLVVFRADTIFQAYYYIRGLVSFTLISKPTITDMPNTPLLIITLVLILFFLILEWFQREKDHALQVDFIKRPLFRWVIYYSIVIGIILLGNFENHSYIYFQF